MSACLICGSARRRHGARRFGPPLWHHLARIPCARMRRVRPAAARPAASAGRTAATTIPPIIGSPPTQRCQPPGRNLSPRWCCAIMCVSPRAPCAIPARRPVARCRLRRRPVSRHDARARLPCLGPGLFARCRCHCMEAPAGAGVCATLDAAPFARRKHRLPSPCSTCIEHLYDPRAYLSAAHAVARARRDA